MANINNVQGRGGRFCNQFFRNMMAHILGEKNALSMKYAECDKMKELGIPLYTGGETKDSTFPPVEIRDSNFMEYITNPEPLQTNIHFHKEDNYCQTKDFAHYLQEYFTKNKWFDTIVNQNKFRGQYKNNENIYVHVRLGDVVHHNPGFDYYDRCLSQIIKYREQQSTTSGSAKAYISSDSINHPICQALIQKYGLIIVSLNEVETILFASTCKYLILSNGTFSWLIGFLGVFSHVFYPKIYQFWHGDIFVFPRWQEVDWKKSI